MRARPLSARLVAPLMAAGLALCAGAAGAAQPAGEPSAPAIPAVSAAVALAQVPIGASATVAGELTVDGRPLPGARLALESDPYPYRGFTASARAQSAPDGSFALTTAALESDTRLRVIDEDAPGAQSADMLVRVQPALAAGAQELGPGATRLAVRVRHSQGAGAGAFEVLWYVAPAGAGTLRLAAVSTSRELGAGVSYASATVDPPARRFEYRVCMDPPWMAAMEPPAEHPPCPRPATAAAPALPAGVEGGGEAQGSPRAAYPSAAAVAAAARYLDTRAGRTSLAVINSAGQLRGVRTREHFETASVVKVMMLTAYLQMLSARRRGLHAADESLLYPMIHESNNDAASTVLGIVGAGALARVAREAGMHDYAPGVGWWAHTQTSAADQARFMSMLEQLIPARFRGYARWLLSHIAPQHSWGIPPAARPRWQVFYKTGSLPEEGIFNEVGLLRRRGLTFTVAVFTAGEPSEAYGHETIQGVAERLLAGSP